jgi:hypothetical protein
MLALVGLVASLLLLLEMVLQEVPANLHLSEQWFVLVEVVVDILEQITLFKRHLVVVVVVHLVMDPKEVQLPSSESVEHLLLLPLHILVSVVLVAIGQLPLVVVVLNLAVLVVVVEQALLLNLLVVHQYMVLVVVEQEHTILFQHILLQLMVELVVLMLLVAVEQPAWVVLVFLHLLLVAPMVMEK